MKQRSHLMSIVSHNRTQMIYLRKAIEGFQRSQRNLQALVDGKSPATGFEGGVFFIT